MSRRAAVSASDQPPLPAPDLERAQRLLLELLAIPGVSTHEGQVMQFVRSQLLAAGATEKALRCDAANTRSPFGGESGNLILQLPGTMRGPRRMLSAHVDTVPICLGARPVVRGQWIVPADKTTGLGADDRSGTAVLLNTALEILTRGLPHPPLTFLWTVQEELGLYGARFVTVPWLGKPRLAFNFDGGPCDKLGIGATGGYRMKIHIRGIASHAGVSPEKGVSAITIAALAIARLQHEGWLGRIERDGKLGTSNVGVIRGGDATNVITPAVELQAEARSHDKRFRMQIVRAIERAFREAAAGMKNVEGKAGKVKIEGRLDYEAFALQRDEPCVAAAAATVKALGSEPFYAISNGGLDANWLAAHGIPTVTLGSGQFHPHTPRERLHLGEFQKACRIALRLATGS